MKLLTPKLISYIVAVCLLFILGTQSYLVYDYFQTTRAGLIRESDAIIEEAFKKDLEIRRRQYRSLKNEDGIDLTHDSKTPEKNTNYDFSKRSDYANNTTLLVYLAINSHISKSVPLNIQRLDSISGTILKLRGITTQYSVKLIEPKSGKIILKSGTNSFIFPIFQISSKYFTIDIIDNKVLQLVLMNPFGIIIKRMGLLLLSSLILSIICMLAFRELFRTLARQKKLMVVKNDFFGNTAHELKRPVAQLHLALEALSKPSTFGNEMKRERYLSISRDATKDMSEKITMIMTLSMAEEGVFNLNYSNFNLLEEVQKLKERFTAVAEKEVCIEIHNSNDDFNLKADKDHLLQCIANLIDNAIKYSGVSVLITIRIQKLKDSLLLSVKDNGIGIGPDKLERIFDKYTRLNSESGSPTGFGIGLSYVKAVVEKHAGHIEVQSEPQKGSEFRVYIPA